MPRGRSIVLKAVFRGVDRMSRTVGRMRKGFKRFTSSARRGIKRVARATRGLRNVLGKALRIGVVTATAAFVGMAFAISRVTAQLDILGKQSKRLDFPVEELQEWGFVAQQSGIDQAEFTKGLDTFAKAVGEAKMGQGTLTTLLKRNNKPLLRQLKNTKNTAEAFEIFTQAMRDVKDPMKQVALGALGFGRSGKKMANITKLTVDEVEALRKEQRQNGIATQETVENAEKFNDAMNSSRLMVQGFLFDALGPLLPELKNVLRDFRAWGIQNKELIRSKIKKFVIDLVQGVKDLFKWFQRFNKEHEPLKKLEATLGGIAKGVGWIADNFTLIKNVLRVAVPLLVGFKLALLIISAKQTIAGLAGTATGVGNIGARAKTAMGRLDKLNAGLGILAAGAIGWQIGSIIHDQVLNPLAKSRAELRRLLSETESRIGRAKKKGDVAEVQAEVTKTKQRVKEFSGGISMEDVAKFFVEGPTKFFQERTKLLVGSVQQIKEGQEFVAKEIALQNEVLRASSSPVVKEFLRTGRVPETEDPEGQPPTTAQMVSPAERVSRSIEERTEKSKHEITVSAAPGASVEITKTQGSSGSLSLQTSGGN